MRLSRFLSITVFITSFSLLYVYQQTEIFRLAYIGQKKQVRFEDLFDKNSTLRYNIKQKASLVNVGDKIWASSDFQMPDTYRLVKLSPSKEGLRGVAQSAKGETILSRLFGIKRQAEAKPISP